MAARRWQRGLTPAEAPEQSSGERIGRIVGLVIIALAVLAYFATLFL